MASTLLPFRQYNEHEVINLYALDLGGSNSAPGNACSNMKVGGAAADWDAGRLVNVSAGTFGDNPTTLENKAGTSSYAEKARAYMGAAYNASGGGLSHVGQVGYPSAVLKCQPGKGGAGSLGITLRDTMAYDENNEKLLYYTVKGDEGQSVLPGQVVPVLRRGLIAMKVEDTGTPSVGDSVYGHKQSAGESGLITTDADTGGNGSAVGEIIAVLDAAQKICLVALDV